MLDAICHMPSSASLVFFSLHDLCDYFYYWDCGISIFDIIILLCLVLMNEISFGAFPLRDQTVVTQLIPPLR